VDAFYIKEREVKPAGRQVVTFNAPRKVKKSFHRMNPASPACPIKFAQQSFNRVTRNFIRYPFENYKL